MAINRYELASRHNPILNKIDYKSPLTIGNGEFAFTADITGLQTLYEEYKEANSPLCTMSQWGWHTTPVGPDRYAYSTSDLEMTEYDYADRKVTYAVEKKPGNEEVYFWLRQNPHRLNLARLSFLYQGNRIRPEDISDIRQTLNLYEGVLDSRFTLKGVSCRVLTACHQDRDVIAVKAESDLLQDGTLSVLLAFPYGSPDITASDFEHQDSHNTLIEVLSDQECHIKRTLDRTVYYADLKFDQDIDILPIEKHQYLMSSRREERLSFSLTFSEQKQKVTPSSEQVFHNSREGWKTFWKEGGAIDLHRSKDERALELERRIVLSMYQSAIQSCGSMPPQETGLTCNSWHGKFHLEMYLWHLAYLPLWNRSRLLERSLHWYIEHLPEARTNAARNGFKGAKWPKQVAYDGIDSPSPIATLLIWQQPHIIYMLELLYQSLVRKEKQGSKESPVREKDTAKKPHTCCSMLCNKNLCENNPASLTADDLSEPKKECGTLCPESEACLKRYWSLIKETADYMADLAVYNDKTGRYELVPPVIPAQEAHDPRNTLNPIFEVEYWRVTLFIAAEWARRLGKETAAEAWLKVAKHMADLPMKDGLYLAHEHCPTTYEEFQKDHPMMVAVYGLLYSDRVDPGAMERTLRKTMECWDYDTMWGWDFAMMAMTATRLGLPELAIELLLKDTPNNQYVISGNNSQKKREDLPLYLPGNGSLLLALPIMVAGYEGCTEETPGFPKNGMWKVEYENINPFPM